MPAGAYKDMEVGGECRSIRILPMDLAEVRLHEDSDNPRIEGYASVFYDGTPETEFKLGTNFVERVMPGAFTETLKRKDDVRALFNHDPSLILGRSGPGTLKLEQDKVGLKYSIELGTTSVAEDVAKHMRRGDVSGSSFGFEITDEEFKMVDEVEIRMITGARVFDVSVVTFPAYEGAEAKLRAEEVRVRSRLAALKVDRAKARENTKRVRRMALTHATERLRSGQNW